MDTTDHGRILGAEFIGTAVLVIGGVGSAVLAGPEIGVLGVSLAFGFSLAIVMYVVGHMSGGHVNPAVTLAHLLARRVTPRQAAFAWVGQVTGGVFGAGVIYGIASGRDGFERGVFASNGWDRDGFSGLGSALVVELVFTALLVLVMLSTTSRRFAPAMGGFVAGLTYAVIHLVTIPVDNTGVNPARSLATALFADTDPGALGQVWVFIVVPLVGALLGVFIWLMVDDEARLEDTMLDTETLRDARDAADRLVD